jgi:hypothetical protein
MDNAIVQWIRVELKPNGGCTSKHCECGRIRCVEYYEFKHSIPFKQDETNPFRIHVTSQIKSNPLKAHKSTPSSTPSKQII